MAKPLKTILIIVGIISALIIISVLTTIYRYSALETTVKNARYSAGCEKIVPMQDIAGYPIPIKTAKGEEIYQLFYFSLYPSYPAQAPGQEPQLLAPGIIAELHNDGSVVCAPMTISGETAQKNYGPRYTAEAGKLSIGTLDSKRSDLFFATEKAAKMYFAGKDGGEAREAAGDFFDQFTYLYEPGFQQFYYELNPDFWQWIKKLTNMNLAYGLTSSTAEAATGIKGWNKIPEEVRPLLPTKGFLFASGGLTSATRRLTIDWDKKTINFGENLNKNSSAYEKMTHENTAQLTDAQLQKINALINEIVNSKEKFSNSRPLVDFDVKLFLVWNDEVKIIDSYGPPVGKVKELYNYVWGLIPEKWGWPADII